METGRNGGERWGMEKRVVSECVTSDTTITHH